MGETLFKKMIWLISTLLENEHFNIAHRLLTLACCDKIYKVDQKKLVAQRTD